MSSGSVNTIRFHYQVEPFHFAHRLSLKKYLFQLFQKMGKEMEAVNYIFCDDAHLLELNKQYLKHNTLTDIISFELSQPESPLLSDIYISTERVKENAFRFQTSFKLELHRVIFHGALHLCGYNDKTSEQARQMRLLEDQCLNGYFVSRGTAETQKR